jgi:membrane associated rhomboid family serine protease
MIARSQSQLDGLLSQAYEARRLADPSWRLGVLDGETPTRNYWAHAFIHDQTAGLLLILAVLLIVAAPLERSWGSLLFAAFVLLSIPVSAQGYRLLDASSGVPWCGTSGLAAALVGAYFIRGLGGRFIVPSVVVLPVWLAIEAFVVRGFWLDDLASVPWATLCGAVGFGAAVAALLRLLNVETKLDARAERRRPAGPNPILVRAARLRSDGDPNQAFELIQAAWRENRQDEEIADVFFSIAAELGQPEAAAEAILPVLRSALKKGQVDRALGYWLPLATRRCGVRLEPTAAVRLGEALLDAGHPDEAVFSLRSALDAGASTAHAIRILNVARDLDPGLTRRAASIALADPGLEAPMRAKLAPLGRPPRRRTRGPRACRSGRRRARSPRTASTAASKPSTTRSSGRSFRASRRRRSSRASRSSGMPSPRRASPIRRPPTRRRLISPTRRPPTCSPTGTIAARSRPRRSMVLRSAPPSSGHAVDTLLESTALAADGDLFGDDDIDFLDLEGDVTDSDQTPLLDASDELTSRWPRPPGSRRSPRTMRRS